MVLKVTLFNVRGLNHPAQRASLWKESLRLGCDLICVQEMHFQASASPTLNHKQFPHIFTASVSQKRKGVLIAVKNSVAFGLHDAICDPEGRYLIFLCDLSQ